MCCSQKASPLPLFHYAVMSNSWTWSKLKTLHLFLAPSVFIFLLVLQSVLEYQTVWRNSLLLVGVEWLCLLMKWLLCGFHMKLYFELRKRKMKLNAFLNHARLLVIRKCKVQSCFLLSVSFRKLYIFLDYKLWKKVIAI